MTSTNYSLIRNWEEVWFECVEHNDFGTYYCYDRHCWTMTRSFVFFNTARTSRRSRISFVGLGIGSTLTLVCRLCTKYHLNVCKANATYRTWKVWSSIESYANNESLFHGCISHSWIIALYLRQSQDCICIGFIYGISLFGLVFDRWSNIENNGLSTIPTASINFRIGTKNSWKIKMLNSKQIKKGDR